MTVYTLQAGLPDIGIVGGMSVVLEAISPTTGLPITGVKVTRVAVYGQDQSAGDTALESGPFVLVPGPNAGGVQ